ncbi:ScbR family autoregulator-binding transcription factor [Streptomyces sp. NPDC012466]|jgi:AcrR family transcriptional regulator|uniref:ScbR family autoregulator-binding transcription factor n=1 Tax=Streptomyces sp. NPDC012466 TaxID=3364835 RepID=UPI0036E080C5
MVKQERALRTREALIESAAEVFDREGFSVASLTAISSRAGVSNGALHFHFASKAALAGAVEEIAENRLDGVTQRCADKPNALQTLVDATHELARALREDVVLRAGFGLSGEPFHADGRNLRLVWSQWVEGTVKRADAEGVLADVPSQDVMMAVVAATVGFEVLGARDGEWLSRRTLTRFWQLLLPLLAAPATLGTLTAEGAHHARTKDAARSGAADQKA